MTGATTPGKKIAGRKRHILVDTIGLLLTAVVHAADVQDRDGARLVLKRAKAEFPSLQLIWADGGYAVLIDWVKTTCGVGAANRAATRRRQALRSSFASGRRTNLRLALSVSPTQARTTST